MKTNIQTLMNLIAEEEKKFSNSLYTVKQFALNTTIEELDGRVNVIEDNLETFENEFEQLESCSNEVSRLKAILYEKNNSFKLSDGRSIQQAIVDNTNDRKLKATYENLLLYKNSKRRVTEVNNSYFECRTINFDASLIKEKVKKLEDKIQKTDFEISKLNSIEFEI